MLLYELFSVMVHSGSAAGGHYYACIKSFSDDQWYSFNDQHVSKVIFFYHKALFSSIVDPVQCTINSYVVQCPVYCLIVQRTLNLSNFSQHCICATKIVHWWTGQK